MFHSGNFFSGYKPSFYYYPIIFVILLSYQCSKNPIISDKKSATSLSSNWETISNPDSVGWSSEKLEEARYYSRTIQTAAVMIIYDGKVLYQWGEVAHKFKVHSCRKSLLSALYGIHVDNGNIDLSKTMGELGIDDIPPSLSELEKTATIRMLLQARSGIYHPAAAEVPSMQNNRPERYSHAPGTFYYYNNWDFNALGTIFNQETGTDLFEEFKRSIADPIGMEAFLVDDCKYEYELVSIHPAYKFRMTARDMARFGLLFLQKGKWNGVQIISEDWITESTSSYSEVNNNGEINGYGYMWIIAIDTGDHLPNVDLPVGSYAAAGAGGHWCIVIPDYNLVIVHRVNTDIGHDVLDHEVGLLIKKILDAKIRQY